MYVCFKQDLIRNVSYVGNTDTMAIGRRIVRKNGHLLQNNLKSIRNRLKKLKNCQKQP